MAAGQVPGLEPVESIDRAGEGAVVFAVDPTSLSLGPDVVPTEMSADAALAWLDLAAAGVGEEIAAARLMAAMPVVSGDSVPALLTRLGLCVEPPDPGGSVTIYPEERCPV
jgi:hypothetical protein